VSEMEGYVAQGFDAVLPKPFDHTALKDCLAEHCADARTRAASQGVNPTPVAGPTSGAGAGAGATSATASGSSSGVTTLG
jgi:hypothetical protein